MEAICDRFRSHCFFTNQMSLLQIFALLLQIFALLLQNFVLYMLLQNFSLLFEMNCTEINQSESSNIFMYIIISVIFSFSQRWNLKAVVAMNWDIIWMLTQLQQFSKPIQLVRLWKLLWSRRQHDAYIEHITRRREDMNFIYLRVAKTIFYNWVRAANELPFRCQLFRPANNYFTWKDKCQAKPKNFRIFINFGQWTK